MCSKVLLLIPFCLHEVLYQGWSIAPGGNCQLSEELICDVSRWELRCCLTYKVSRLPGVYWHCGSSIAHGYDHRHGA